LTIEKTAGPGPAAFYFFAKRIYYLLLLADPDDLLPDGLPPVVFDFFDAPPEGDLLAAVVLPLEPLFELVLLLEPVLLFDLADVFGEVPLLAEAADRLPLPDALLAELFAVPVFDCAFFPPDDVFAAPAVSLREPAELLDFVPLALELDLLELLAPEPDLLFVLRPFPVVLSLVAISAALDAAPTNAPVAAPLTSSATTFFARSSTLSIVFPFIEESFFDPDPCDPDRCVCLAIPILPCSNLIRSLQR